MGLTHIKIGVRRDQWIQILLNSERKWLKWLDFCEIYILNKFEFNLINACFSDFLVIISKCFHKILITIIFAES
jgi:uncharacterized protein involved in cysteine biosynthesis